MRFTLALTALVLPALVLPSLVATAAAQSVYHPGPGGQWDHKAPGELGINAGRLEQAVAFAKASESTETRDLEQRHFFSFGLEPHGDPVGPFKTRGEMTGVIVRNGYIVAEWGQPHRVDMTFSVSKSFLSTVVGLAWDEGLIRDIGDRVEPLMPNDHFASAHNQKITWDHLLRQTSNWQGTLWGKPDWADRPPKNADLEQWMNRERDEPGAVYKYNDTRVNLLALAALEVWRRPLPQVLKERVMDPIGASNTWRWYGYENSWVVLDGLKVQSVSGGGHWGGGMFLSARDQARFGLFTLRRGKWNGKQLLADQWFTWATTPGKANAGYGFMNYFLNTDRKSMPAAPETAYAHRGSGTNLIYVDPVHDLVVVARWIQGRAIPEFIEKVLAAVE